MLAIVFCAYIAYRISQLATRKGANAILWVVIALLSFFFAQVIGAFFLVAIFYKGDIKSQEQLLNFFYEPARGIFITFCGVGGYLLVKYILERRQDKPDETGLPVEEEE